MMTIVKCNNKDSLGRPCSQFKDGERFCGYPNCNHIATQYLRYKEGLSDEGRRWLTKHRPTELHKYA